MLKTKLFMLIVVIALTQCVLTSCGEANAAMQTEVLVFAAASLTETLQEIAGLYAKENPNVKLVFNFDSSGTLKTQIENGAACDVFISAGQKQMNQIDITASVEVNTAALDLIDSETRKVILQNRIVLAVSPNNKKNIASFDVWADMLANGEVLLAMGNGDVPVGQYTQQILKYYGLIEEELAAAGVISYGSNVKEVTTQIAEGSVDCGVIYCTDAFQAGLEITDYADEAMSGLVIYPAAVTKKASNKQAAIEFLSFLNSVEAARVFENAGFAKP